MKKILLLFVCTLIGVSAEAGKVTEQEALQKAIQFMPNKQFVKSSTRRAPNNTTVSAYYIFNAEDGGFVIIAGDDRAPNILGYSEKGNLDIEKAPCNVKWLLDYYHQTISSLSESQERRVYSSSDTKANISPMLETQWGQEAPYNRLCPIIEGQRCVAGCSATALAQVLYYNRWPQGMTSSVPAYTTKTHKISMPELPPTQFDWNNMSENALSRLTQYCGQAILMDYGPNDSGALPTDYAPALINVFGYNSDVCIEARANYSDNEWNDLIYKELNEGRVVVYSGYTFEWGHSFVIDGYESGKYHINWGWDGNFDGYFTLNYLNPNGISFNLAQTAIINIMPPDGHRIQPSSICVTELSCSTTGVERTAITEDFPSFTAKCSIKNKTASNITLQVGLGLYNDDGFVAVLKQEEHQFTGGDTFEMMTEVTLGSTLADGSYRIVPISRENDTMEWQTMSGSTIYYISVVVNQLAAVLQSYHRKGNTIEYGEHVINGVNYRLYSEYGNNRAKVMPLQGGKKYAGDIYVQDIVSYQNMLFVTMKYTDYEFREVFYDCPELSSLSTGVYEGAAYNCPNLTQMEIREGNLSCYLCELPKIENIVVPSTCTYATIEGLENIKSISFLNPHQIFLSWTNIDENSMPLLKDVYFYSAMPPTFHEAKAIPTSRPDVTIHIPHGSLEAYKNSVWWKDWNFVEDLPAQEGVFFDYCGTDPNFNFWDISGWSGLNAVFKGEDKDTELAIKIPADQIAPFIGGKVTKVMYFAPQQAVNGDNSINYEYAFITKPGSDYVAKKQVTPKRETWNEMKLDEPYTITGEELFVGVGRHGGIEMPMVNSGELSSGIWFRSMDDSANYNEKDGIWERYEDYQIRMNKEAPYLLPSFPLPIQLVIEGGNFPTEMRIIKVEKDDTTHNDRIKIKVKIRSRAPQLIKKFSLGIYDDGRLQDIQFFDKVLVSGFDDEVEVSVPKREGEGYHIVTIRVLEVNDGISINNDGNEASTFYMQPFTSTLTYPRKVVMEEFTGTWCGYSPRGIETINMLKELYPNNFIPIENHISFDVNEPMYDPGNGYYRILGPISTGRFRPFGKVGAVPSCIVNRKEWYDPSPDILKEIIAAEKNNAIAQIMAQACFYDADSTKVLVTTQSQFGFNSRGSEKYSIAYVVLEDHVGPYWQANYFAGTQLSEEYKYLEWWIRQNGGVEMYYDNVARGIYDSWLGSSETIPPMIMAGETYNGQYLLTLPETIQQKKNVHLAVLLMDKQTGEILNADHANIVGSVLQHPVIIAKNATKVYGDANPSFDYEIVGDVSGKPALSCEADETSPVGTYPISVSLEAIANYNNTCIAGTLTIFEAPLSVSVGNYEKKQGEENPVFTLTYEGFKNNETESVLTKKPMVTTTATKESVPGEYSLTVSGGEARNYELTYQNGILTVTESAGISTIISSHSADVYSLQGHKVRTITKSFEDLPKGIYIANGQKIVIK